MKQNKIIAFILLLPLFFFIGNVYAHKVSISAHIRDGAVYTGSTYNDNYPVKNGTIKVFDVNDKLLLSGKTDNNGKFSFIIPPNEKELKIVLTTYEGHRDELKLSIHDTENKS